MKNQNLDIKTAFLLFGDLTDINECNLPTTSCEHECINSKGSYNCTCRPGFYLNADKTTCTGIACGVIYFPLSLSITYLGSMFGT